MAGLPSSVPLAQPPRKSLNMERGASHTRFRTITPQASLRSCCLCTVPAGCAQTPQAWRKLGVRGTFPPLRPTALGLRKAWGIRPVEVAMGRERCLPRRCRLDLDLSLHSKDRSKRLKKTELSEALCRKEEQPSRISQLEAGGTGPLDQGPHHLGSESPVTRRGRWESAGWPDEFWAAATQRGHAKRPRGLCPVAVCPRHCPKGIPPADLHPCLHLMLPPATNRKPALGCGFILSANTLKIF